MRKTKLIGSGMLRGLDHFTEFDHVFLNLARLLRLSRIYGTYKVQSSDATFCRSIQPRSDSFFPLLYEVFAKCLNNTTKPVYGVWQPLYRTVPIQQSM